MNLKLLNKARHWFNYPPIPDRAGRFIKQQSPSGAVTFFDTEKNRPVPLHGLSGARHGGDGKYCFFIANEEFGRHGDEGKKELRFSPDELAEAKRLVEHYHLVFDGPQPVIVTSAMLSRMKRWAEQEGKK